MKASLGSPHSTRLRGGVPTQLLPLFLVRGKAGPLLQVPSSQGDSAYEQEKRERERR